MKPYHARQSDLWQTPAPLFNHVLSEFAMVCDVAAGADNHKLPVYFDEATNGLSQDWSKHGLCWMNPPYSRINDWMKKANHEAKKGVVTVCLVPARPDTRWWWAYAIPNETRFIKGRLKFVGAASSAPFPSALIIVGYPSSVRYIEVPRGAK